MYPPKKSVAPLVLGIVSIIMSIVFALVGLICGIIGLVLALNGSKASQVLPQSNDPFGNPVAPFNYKTEIILNSIGIGLAVINMIAAVFLLVNMGGGF